MKIILYSIAFAAMLLSATNALAAGSVSKSAVQATAAATATSASSKIDALLDSYESAINSASAVADKAKKGDKAARSSLASWRNKIKDLQASLQKSSDSFTPKQSSRYLTLAKKAAQLLLSK